MKVEMNTHDAEPGLTWPRWTFTAQPFSDGCGRRTGIAPFDRLVDQVMPRPPYNDARRVFWIVDNGPSHRGLASVQRLRQKYPKLVLIHGPVTPVGVNQIK
jgi:hypothetical protein